MTSVPHYIAPGMDLSITPSNSLSTYQSEAHIVAKLYDGQRRLHGGWFQ